MKLRFIPIKLRSNEVEDFYSEEETNALFNTVFNTIRDYKNIGYRIELVIAGGRKPMSIYPVISAQILFDENDRAWHLLSEEKLVKSRNLLPEDDMFYQLVPIPLMLWSNVPPTLLVDGMTPQQFIENQQQRSREQGELKYRKFMGLLTRVERDVLKALLQGLSNEDISKKLKKSRRTVEHQIQRVYSKFKTSFGLPVQSKISRQHFLRTILLYRIGKSADADTQYSFYNRDTIEDKI